eukprot:TRINITY_DN3882_c0_g1_i1.p1 TRINITY_DN3882_c0_g1~~TRINITY_DN3882_c0_g1_i1.p1  ORF type:complete len:366 (-),score=138.46 TRINITY_DN3882_c0_g1_i1:69-1166(-)
MALNAESALLWVDKYRPSTIEQLSYHPQLSSLLLNLAQQRDFPHLLFYGPSGAGKKTRIIALLRKIFGPDIEKLKLETKTFKPSEKDITLEIATVGSKYHLELTPAEAGYYDQYVVQEVIKEIAQTRSLVGSFGDTQTKTFKVIILNEAERLSRTAQQALRRTMEKYSAMCRLIICCKSLTRLIEPLRSRTLPICVGAPTDQEIITILESICKSEGLQIPKLFAQRIAMNAQGNLRRAILSLEASKVSCYPFKNEQMPELPDWEEYIVLLAKDIAEEQSPRRLIQVRQKLYELLSHCIPAEVIIQNLTLELMKKVDSQLKCELANWAAYYEHRMQLGNKPIFHLEAFVAKFMSIYAKFIVATFGE